MANPLWSLIPKAGRQVLPFVQAGVRRGMSSRAIEQTIRDAGIRISRTRTILPLMRELKQIEQAGRTIRNIGKSKTINVNRLPTSITPLRRKYSYTVRVIGRDAGGARSERYITISSNSDSLTPEYLEDKAANLVRTSGEYAMASVEGATLQSGLRASNVL